jgi:NAD(P)-dependent dehydrogenase (short-subunit alcohol dehydrogenase family)
MDRLALTGRVAIVTGAGAGLGAAVAELLAAAGARVLCADRDGVAAARTGVRIGGDSAMVDVTDRAAVFAAIGAFAESAGRLDILCNIAGVASSGDRIEDMGDAAFDRVFDANFKGTLFGCQAALPFMQAAKRGAIINMASSAIDLAIPGNASYSISKAAVVMLSKVLANEVGADGIRVNAVAPGFVPTALSMGAAVQDDASRAAYLDRWAARAPLGRVGATDDVAQQFLYLASDAAAFVTGQVLRANGGTTMPW